MNNKTITFLAAAILSAASASAAPDTAKEAAKVRGIITKVNNHWQQTNPPETRSFWDNAAYHTGNMEAYFLTGNEEWKNYSERWAEHNEWKGAKGTDRSRWKYDYGETDDHVLFGDWQICFQTYADLYRILPDDRRIRRAREVMEYEMSTPRNDYWWWADGLYMVMPVMTKMHRITGNKKYLDKLYEYVLVSDSIMYDPDEALYYRDAKYVYPAHKKRQREERFLGARRRMGACRTGKSAQGRAGRLGTPPVLHRQICAHGRCCGEAAATRRLLVALHDGRGARSRPRDQRHGILHLWAAVGASTTAI